MSVLFVEPCLCWVHTTLLLDNQHYVCCENIL